MRFATILVAVFFLKACGSSVPENKNVIGQPEPTAETPVITPPTETPSGTTLPKGAVSGNFNGDNRPFYGHVKRINKGAATTTIAFENKQLPAIVVPDSYGATLESLQLAGFDREILMVNAKLKDPNFNKYYLYVLRNKQWKPVVNGFAIHKSNLKDVPQPIWNDPSNPNKLMRHYSVFDLDTGGGSGYTWLLLEESVPIENR